MTESISLCLRYPSRHRHMTHHFPHIDRTSTKLDHTLCIREDVYLSIVGDAGDHLPPGPVQQLAEPPPHPSLLWLSVSLADTVTALCLIISLLSHRTTTWLNILTAATSYSSIISVSSLSIDKMFSIAKPFNYTLYRWSSSQQSSRQYHLSCHLSTLSTYHLLSS